MLEPIQANGLTERASQQTNYVVRLPLFEGPLDLLLHLIEKRQMEITTISLVAVTDQYIAYLQRWREEELPLANMAAFVSIAARLLFIKSQSLLPQSVKEETNSESATVMAEELQRHLVAYKLSKEIAAFLRAREEAGLQTYSRSSLLSGIETQLACTPPTLTGLELPSLVQAFQRVLAMPGRTPVHGSAPRLMPVARVRVSERMAVIVSRLQECESLLLSEILADEQSRFVIVVTFIAVLELWKWRRIDVQQEGLWSPLVLVRGERWLEVGEDEVED